MCLDVQVYYCYYYFRLTDVLGEPAVGQPVPTRVLFFHLFRKKISGINGDLRAGSRCCHPNISVKSSE